MSKTIENIYTLYNNPFLLTPIILEFYRHYHGDKRNCILLSYLIFPLVLFETSKEGLWRANGRRTVMSFCKEKETIFGLSERMNAYIELTNQCFQYAMDRHVLFLKDDLSVHVIGRLNVSPRIDRSLKAAKNLAIMLSKNPVATNFILFGIKKIGKAT